MTKQKDCIKCIYNNHKINEEPCKSCMSVFTEYKPKYEEKSLNKPVFTNKGEEE